MRLTLALGAFCFGCALAASGCPRDADTRTLPLLTSENPVAEDALREAERAVQAGDLSEGESRYRAFLRDHGDDPLLAVAKLDLGRLLLATDRVAEARALFAEVAAHPETRIAERARLHQGVTAHLSGDDDDALALLTPLVDRTVVPEETLLLLRTLAASRTRASNRIGAVEALDRLLRERLEEIVRDEVRQELLTLTDALDTEESLALAGRLARDGEAWPLVARRALREAFATGQLARVRDLASQLRAERVPLDAELQSMALRAERTGRVDPHAIGAILPLSGRGREVGQLALQALMMAAGQPADGPRPGGTRLFFRDTAGDPEAAARAVDDLVSLHQVVAIVGPLDARAATVAARRAEALGVPLVTLAPDASLATLGTYVFRAAPTPAEEALALVQRAKALGSSSVAVMAPEHAYGQVSAEAFCDAARAEGLSVAGVVTYPTGATSFRESLDALRALRFDVLFVPDHARAIAVVAPALAAGGLGAEAQVRLLLPSVAWDASLTRTSGRYLQGALISRPFLPEADPEAQRFQDAFVARYRRSPDMLAALAHDVLALVRGSSAGLPETEGARDVLRQRMTNASLVTATSLGGFAPDRSPLRATRVYEVRGDLLVP